MACHSLGSDVRIAFARVPSHCKAEWLSLKWPTVYRLILRFVPFFVAAGCFAPQEAHAAEPAPYVRPAASPRFILPLAQLVLGPLMPVSPKEDPPALALHIQGGALIGWPGRNTLDRLFVATYWLRPELSYEYRRVDPPAGTPPPAGEYDHRQGHLVSLGMGAGYGNVMFLLGLYSARLVVGAIQNTKAEGEIAFNPAVGFRHGLSGMFLGSLFSLNLEHQMISLRDVLRHEILFTVGINLAMPGLVRLL